MAWPSHTAHAVSRWYMRGGLVGGDMTERALRDPIRSESRTMFGCDGPQYHRAPLSHTSNARAPATRLSSLTFAMPAPLNYLFHQVIIRLVARIVATPGPWMHAIFVEAVIKMLERAHQFTIYWAASAGSGFESSRRSMNCNLRPVSLNGLTLGLTGGGGRSAAPQHQT
ncbi:hypothetical protein BGY98DRAFT_954992 [Russula aff. rugulosa BPL654]|nr:hypothetical protein BGY98DRAFT_986522 [Russula aff. rugulosa BPL654]KAI0282254.1 hypothetical protein BGY98DRAFT_954992 [Russula aff. rugulosa BPL654]